MTLRKSFDIFRYTVTFNVTSNKVYRLRYEQEKEIEVPSLEEKVCIHTHPMMAREQKTLPLQNCGRSCTQQLCGINIAPERLYGKRGRRCGIHPVEYSRSLVYITLICGYILKLVSPLFLRNDCFLFFCFFLTCSRQLIRRSPSKFCPLFFTTDNKNLHFSLCYIDIYVLYSNK